MAHPLPLASTPSPSLVSAGTWKQITQLSSHQSRTETSRDKSAASYFRPRRVFIHGLIGAGIGLSVASGSADAAARRPPPPPPVEKKDPNVTGLKAKILASKKRKEAMQEEVARLREKGKPAT